MNEQAVHGSAGGKRKRPASPPNNPDIRLLQQQIFACFMLFVYTELVNPVLGACFYATEAEGRGFETLFFRQPIWQLVVRRGLTQMNSHFVPVLPAV